MPRLSLQRACLRSHKVVSDVDTAEKCAYNRVRSRMYITAVVRTSVLVRVLDRLKLAMIACPAKRLQSRSSVNRRKHPWVFTWPSSIH